MWRRSIFLSKKLAEEWIEDNKRKGHKSSIRIKKTRDGHEIFSVSVTPRRRYISDSADTILIRLNRIEKLLRKKGKK
jgi:hypothetical protein